jgi:GTPase SAR1 family protein
MEFIRRKIDRKIKFLTANNQTSELKIYYQVRFEYLMVYILGYLWNKNLEKIDVDDREYVINKIFRPSIGDIIEISRKLDFDKEFFNNKRLNQAFEKYPKLRNERIGHGYTFEDGNQLFLESLQDLYESILSCSSQIIQSDVELILVTSFDGINYQGIRFLSDGAEYMPWSCPKEAFTFQVNSLYGCINSYTFFRLSPFIDISNDGEGEAYIYCSVQEKLLGQIKYNHLFKTQQIFKDWVEFCQLTVESDNIRKVSPNKTIINVFQNNYKRYIPVEIKKKIVKFLLTNKASVCATVWGHGGVGKTATIQSLCEDLSNETKKYFDYIIFLTAKDRFYNYYTGTIGELTEKVDSLEGIVQNINNLLFNNPINDIQPIIEYKGKLFLIIDDFETFLPEEKEKISEFIKQLNINHHKVVITTRADIRIGEEIPTSELSEEETLKFLLEVIKIEQPNVNIPQFEKELTENDNYKLVYQITSGRPLFIFQFAILYGQKRSVPEALKLDIKTSKTAIEFLYGRIYDYLSKDAQNVFVVLSQLVTENDLSNVLEKAQFVLNLEHQEDKFRNAVNELVKLRIIEIKENDFFYVYSKEILQIMSDYFNGRESEFKGSCIRRLNQVSRDKKLDNEHALLQNANASRVSKTEQEVISLYRHILNRATSPKEVKIQAILNLAAYLFNDRGKRENAVDLLEEYEHNFFDNGNFVRMISVYSWALNSSEYRNKAINKLLDYLSKNTNLKNDINLELLGLVLTYRSIATINERDELKSRSNFGSLTQREYLDLQGKQKDTFIDIFKKQGMTLFGYVKVIDLDSVSSGARGNTITGLFHFIEVCIRINRHDIAEEICIHSFKGFPRNFHPQFKTKLAKIFRFAKKKVDIEKLYDRHNTRVYEFPASIPKDEFSELGEKLRTALDKK